MSVTAADAPDDSAFFETKIRPVLVEHCYKCHSVDAKKVRGGLLLDSREGIRQGGESGPGVVPTKLDESLVLDAIRYASFEMPPTGKLPDHVIADFETWITAGAADPRESKPTSRPASDTIDIAAAKQFWSFRPLRLPAVPTTQDSKWPESNIDRLLLSKLESEEIGPVGDADRVTLMRRAYYTLIGLPPTPEGIEEFLHDPSPTPIAFAQLVDRLLQSKHFGERWGRHWLDVVRFAESSGGGRTLLFPNAWRYRDYVIEAFNEDMPYDQFLREQIAGDLLPAQDWKTRRRQLNATTFLLLGPTNYELQDKDILEMDIVDEQLDTVGKAFLGMTIGCARCHDHKFDPIPITDYYAMAGIFKSTKSVIHSNVSAWNTVNLPVSQDLEVQLTRHEAKISALNDRLKNVKNQLKKDSVQLLPRGIPRPTQPQRPEVEEKSLADKESRAALTMQVKELESQLKALTASGPTRPVAMAPVEDEHAADIRLAIRGVVHNEGPVIPRGVLQIALSYEFPEIAEHESGRIQLADWIVDASNPLTSRVIVNRVWYWLFGEGLVRTVDNFGAMGEKPSHPELLDHLAVEFIRDGWSLRRLIRRIMLSHVYRLKSTDNSFAKTVDPNNRLMWRMNRLRLDAESIRDSLLQVSGRLDLQMGGANIKPETTIEYDYVFDSLRRSVYLPVFRNTLPQIFATFDFADPNIQGGKRTTSTIASQALLLMNHPFVIEQSRHAARRLLNDRETDPENRIDYCYRQVLGRDPTTAERKLASQFLGADPEEQRWSLLYQTLFQSLDFRYVE